MSLLAAAAPIPQAEAVPAIASVYPSLVPAGGPAFTLTVTGSNFDRGAVARWNGTPLATRVANSALLTADVPAALIAAAGTANVTVANPDGRVSAPSPIGIRTEPMLQGCSPSLVEVNGPPFTLVCAGANFVPGMTTSWEETPLATTIVSATELRAAVPSELLVKPGRFIVWARIPTGEAIGGHSVTVVSPPPAGQPLITSGSSGPLVLGGGPADLVLRGSNFVPGSVIRFLSTPLRTTFVSSTQLEATVPASAITFAGEANVTVANPDGLVSNRYSMEVLAQPVLQSISPAAVAARGPAFALTVRGQGFSRSATILWSLMFVETVYVSGTQLTAYIPATFIPAPAAVPIQVYHHGAAISEPRVLAITNGSSPVVAISDWNAPGVQPGSSGVTVSVNGSGFVSGSTVWWDNTPLETNRIGPTQLEAYLPSRLFTTAGTASLRVVNPDGSRSEPTDARIGPTTILSLSPASAVAGESVALKASGTFPAGSVLRWNGAPLTTVRLAYHEAQVYVPKGVVEAPGTISITAVAPNGASSSPFLFRITSPTPAITAASAGDLMAGDPASMLTVTGSGFIAGSVVTWNGAPLTTTFGGPAQLQAAVPASLIALPGSAQVRVVNGEGSSSNPMTVLIPALAIRSIAPSSAQAGGPALTLTVNGSFKATTVVQWNGAPLPTTFVNATRLTAAVPATFIAAGGTASITAANPGGATSAPAAFQISPPPATISAGGVVNAASPQGSIAPGSLISIYASGLSAGSAFAESTPLPAELNGVSVLINGVRAPLLFAGESQINAQVPYEIPPGPATVVVRRGAGASEAARIDVKAAGPGIFAIPPGNHAVAQNAADFSLNSAEHPARSGQYVILYVTGQGMVEPPVATGAAAPGSPLSYPSAKVEATIGGLPATVAFAGLAPGMAGVLQVNLLVPEGVSGEVAVEVTIAGQASPRAILSVAEN